MNNILLEILKSLNQGNSGYATDRVDLAVKQYNQLVEIGAIDGNMFKLPQRMKFT